MIEADLTKGLDRLKQAQGDPVAMALATLDFWIENHPKGAELELAISIASVPHWYDKQSLALLLGIDDSVEADVLWEDLRGLPMVETFSRRGRQVCAVHEATRLALRRRMYDEDLSLLREISGRFIAYVGKSDDPDAVAEKLYHQLIAMPDEGAQACEDLIRDWVNGARPEKRGILRGVLEELEETQMVDGRARAAVLLGIGWILFVRGDINQFRDKMDVALNVASAANAPRLLAQAICMQGDIHATEGNVTKACLSFEDALRRMEVLLTGNAFFNGQLFDYSVVQSRLGESYIKQGRFSEGFELFGQSAKTSEALLKADPSNVGLQRKLASALHRIGDVLYRQGRLREAGEYYKNSLEILDRATDRHPSYLDIQRDICLAHLKIGDALRLQGFFDDSFEASEKALKIAQSIIEIDPFGAEWQVNLVFVLTRIGDLLFSKHRAEEALAVYTQTLSIANEAAQYDPGNAQRQEVLATTFSRIGDVHELLGQSSEAIAAYSQSAAIADKLLLKDAENADFQRNHAVALAKIGDAILRSDHSESVERLEAYRLIKKSVEVAERLAAIDPLNAVWQHDLAVAYGKLAKCNEAQGKFPTALNLLQKSSKAHRALVLTDSTNAVAQQQLATTLINVAIFQKRQGKPHLGRAAALEAQTILDSLARSHPDYVEVVQQSDLVHKLLPTLRR